MSADAPRGALLRLGRLIFGDLDFPVGYMRVIYTVGPQTPHTRKGPRYHTRCPRDLSSSASVGRLAVLLVLAPPCSLALLPARHTPQLALRHSEILEQLPPVRLARPVLAAPKRVELLLLGILGAAGGGGGGARGANRDQAIGEVCRTRLRLRLCRRRRTRRRARLQRRPGTVVDEEVGKSIFDNVLRVDL